MAVLIETEDSIKISKSLVSPRMLGLAFDTFQSVSLRQECARSLSSAVILWRRTKDQLGARHDSDPAGDCACRDRLRLDAALSRE